MNAKWSGVANSYSVEFDANGGSGTMAPEAMTCGKPRALTANAFKRVGYDFAGWRDGEGNEYRNKESVLNLSETDGGVVTLYAQWEPVVYKITYKGLCAFDTNPNRAIYTVEDPVDFNHLDDPVRAGVSVS